MFRKASWTAFAAAAAAVALSAGLVGCAPGESGGGTADPDSTGTPVAGGTLRVGLGPITGKIANLGFSGSYLSSQETFASMPALETLVQLDETGAVVPWLATEWEMDPEARTITFSLRDGVVFHDGAPFNADAVIWNIDQVKAAGIAEFANVSGATAADELTVVVQLEEWRLSQLNSFATYLNIYSPESGAQGEEFMRSNPVGTGPFVFDEFTPDVSVKYTAFGDYWQEGKPYLDAVELYPYRDENSLAASLTAGEIDAAFVPAPLTVRQLESNPELEVIQLESGVSSGLEGIYTSSADENSPFADPLVRKAVGHAIDVESLQPTFTFGYSVLTDQYAAPTFETYNPEVVGTPYDPDTARELLEEAGYANGFSTSISGVGGYTDLMTAIQAQLAEVGIEATVQVLDPGAFDAAVSPTGGWDGLMMSAVRLEPDLATFMPRYYSANASRFGAHIQHPEDVAQLFKEVVAAPDLETQLELSHELQKLVFDEYTLATPLWVTTRPSVVYSYVHDSGMSTVSGSTWTPGDVYMTNQGQ